jgi:hypothetical protein
MTSIKREDVHPMPWEPFTEVSRKGILNARQFADQFASHVDVPHLILGVLESVFTANTDFATLLNRGQVSLALITNRFTAKITGLLPIRVLLAMSQFLRHPPNRWSKQLSALRAKIFQAMSAPNTSSRLAVK